RAAHFQLTRTKGYGHPQLCLAHEFSTNDVEEGQRKSKILGHHTDDREAPTVEHDPSSDHSWYGAEVSLPQAMTNNYDIILAGTIWLWRKPPDQYRLNG